jgi:hypothetical protein
MTQAKHPDPMGILPVGPAHSIARTSRPFSRPQQSSSNQNGDVQKRADELPSAQNEASIGKENGMASALGRKPPIMGRLS